ncbi:MAG: HupE/UreJ family protein [Limisphaerales bacterium]
MNPSFPRYFRWFAMAFAFVVAAPTLRAHTQSDAYLTFCVKGNSLTGEWHLALRDLEDAVGLDANDDGVITWGELLSRKDVVTAYALSRLHVAWNGRPSGLRPTDFLVDTHSDGAYAVVRFAARGDQSPANLEVTYNAFFDIDPKHRGLFRLEQPDATRLAVFSPDTATQFFDLAGTAPRASFLTFVREGVWHIWSGYDHILFLLALLLPGVLRRGHGAWQPVPAARPALVSVLKVVTAFTVAHSITLSLAATGIVHLPGRLIESSIAASVVLAAVNNITPMITERGWMVAFGFGLLHGFGFANALADLGLRHGQLAVTLFGFNLGVEIGQLAIVAVFLPVSFSLRGLFFYRRFVLQAGSVAIMAIATTWLAERVFDFKWLPF